MASKSRPIRLPEDLAKVADARAKHLGYASYSAYIKGLIRYDALVQGPHQISLPWAQLPLEAQDKIDAELLDLCKDGVGKRGQYLRRVIDGTSNDE
jgi:hypothetical protein